ncbi:hypothetical protein Syun_030610 [Stephania yunnanensis]|uniref:Uncharacterized protein n=1 Tax=Stephania yunnanensis TaxID=152371 RepID=A0AAP0DY11_9MAGN
MDDAKFSSPMSVIGLYITGATCVCLLLMLYDIFNAFRQRKPWIPCQFFTINSFTLSLLSVATKLPVDLTTSMPSAYDQLSKLCGTSLMCISIGFFRPSIVNMNESELSANLASLTLMVITIIVNVSLQMSTGAIFLFKVEHIIVCGLMSLLLAITASVKSAFPDYLSEDFRMWIRYMPRNIHSLKRCYIYSYITSPQLMFCRFSNSATAGVLSTICFVVLSEATIRAYRLEGLKSFHKELVSDYKWSIWGVVGMQIVTLIVGTFAIVFRCLALASQMHSLKFVALKQTSFLDFYKMFMFMQRNWNLYAKASKCSRVVFQSFEALQCILDSSLFLISFFASCMEKMTLIILHAARKICFPSGISRKNKVDVGTIVMLRREFVDELKNASVWDLFNDRLLWKSSHDMEICIQKHSMNPTNPLLEFLGKSLTQESLGLSEQISRSSDGLLSLVCLVRMTDLLAPSVRVNSLVSAFNQAFEVIVFIHERTTLTNTSSVLKINVAKDIWISRDITSHWFQNDFINCLKTRLPCTDHIFDWIKGIANKNTFVEIVRQEVTDIINVIGEPIKIQGNWL